jgi:hypothetical protein
MVGPHYSFSHLSYTKWGHFPYTFHIYKCGPLPYTERYTKVVLTCTSQYATPKVSQAPETPHLEAPHQLEALLQPKASSTQGSLHLPLWFFLPMSATLDQGLYRSPKPPYLRPMSIEHPTPHRVPSERNNGGPPTNHEASPPAPLHPHHLDPLVATKMSQPLHHDGFSAI